MPLIQELPNSSTSTTPGWALVPDTGYDPSKQAIVPSGARSRSKRIGNTAAISTKHQAKVASYVESLKKDAPRDPNIVVPGKGRDASTRGLHGKMTPAVKRIVTSQKTFSNHLADEEAFLANRPPDTAASASRRVSGKIEKVSAGTKRRASSLQVSTPIDPTDVEAPSAEPEAPLFKPAVSAFAETAEDSDPFYMSKLPEMPSREEIDALLARPALPYSEAAADPTKSSAGPRQFCDICNYWGRVKCLRCNARVCGLECKVRHEESRCYPY